MNLSTLIWVALGGGAGSVARAVIGYALFRFYLHCSNHIVNRHSVQRLFSSLLNPIESRVRKISVVVRNSSPIGYFFKNQRLISYNNLADKSIYSAVKIRQINDDFIYHGLAQSCILNAVDQN